MPAIASGRIWARIVTLFGLVSATLLACRSTSPRPGHGRGSGGAAAAEEASIRVDTATVAVNGTRLYYEAAGEGPAVVLLHGGNLDRRLWDPQFLALAREHRVVRYDLRGFGRSRDRDGPFQAHEDLRALLDMLGVPRASLVGLSGGGRIAIDFAFAYPDRVHRLVLAAPGLSGWVYRDRGDTAYFPEARRARDRGDAAGMGIAWLGSAYMWPAMEHPALVVPLREMAAANGKAWLSLLKHRTWSACWCRPRPDARRRSARRRCSSSARGTLGTCRTSPIHSRPRCPASNASPSRARAT
jgi:pimeloyl-ACP methyl ester carboxylesterase